DLYPYQWCWDTGPIALGWAAASEWDHAWGEIEALLSAQWSSGLVPHIVFWADGDSYFPGPSVWDTGRSPESSGITQPPLPASAAARLFRDDPDRDRARSRLAGLWPELVSWLAWIDRTRTGPHGAYIVVHPWESGMDNAPCYDTPLAAVPPSSTDLRRRDITQVAKTQRPTDREYRRYLAIVEQLRDRGWDTERQPEESPFAVEDVGFTAITCRAAADLADVAPGIGAEVNALERIADRAHAGIGRLWDDAAGWFRPYDVRAGHWLGPVTVGGLLALWARAATPAQIARLVQRLDDWRERTAFAVPTCDPEAPEFDRRRYWRGPVWVIVNWLVADGLVSVGEHGRADELRTVTRQRVEAQGFREYYDPTTGQGIGGDGFSWSAALTLAWLTDTLPA
ncbi:MAG TPA: trehalase family glycosidase, partial [Acidimicrobiia bacterium]|nr:trehalase family glycosidase [Acidimicrobiia bacterium]